MEETVTGVKVTGRWKDVVDTGKEATETLKQEADEESVAEWDEWRPREHEDLDMEVKDKTVEKAVVRKNQAERAGKGPVEEAQQAAEEAQQAAEEALHGDIETAATSSWRALYAGILSVDMVVRKLFRGLEYVVYRHLMARTGPQYFDSELVSASITRTGGSIHRRSDGEEFELSINVNDDSVQDTFKEQMVLED